MEGEGHSSYSDSDSDSEEFCGMEQPPLIRQLKTILAEYPDDGQIIKELVQNAEDAGASNMKILYDGRRLNIDEKEEQCETKQEETATPDILYERHKEEIKAEPKKTKTKKMSYQKFFKAPALCFYNNAVFSKKDWRGIRMISSSVKEEDPLKVGRFGLGFKSVFHMTDNPCIVSGNRILLMNPHETDSGKVCFTIKLKKIEKSKHLKVDELLAALSGTFDFSENNLRTGHYDGTVFWFPLRETPSNLSGTCYDRSKVLDLFRSFQSEAVHSLLFLKSLSKVELCCRGADSEYDLVGQEEFFSVELDDTDGRIQQERKRFLSNVKSSCGTQLDKDIVSTANPTFKTYRKTTPLSICEEHISSWLVINVYKGEKMSERLENLIGNKDMSYMPYVGAAVPLRNTEEPLKGHIFCFLPLPQEKKSLTGLPVHLNGFFALSQNRRHLKWASADQENLNMHLDKDIEWNECLVKELIPGVYMRLIKEMIAISVKTNNTQEAVSSVYSCIPDYTAVDDRWEGCLTELYRQLMSEEFVFVPKHSKWSSPNQPLYTMFDNQCVSDEERIAVTNLLNLYYALEHTDVPVHIWRLLRKYASPKDVSPVELRTILESEDTYKHKLNDAEKIILLEYLLKENDETLLQGLELLPLENGSFTTFLNTDKTVAVYYCCKEEMDMFPGLEKYFVASNLSKRLQDIMTGLASSGKFQLKTLMSDDMARLLRLTIQTRFGNSGTVHLTMSAIPDKRFENWIEIVWAYIFKRFSLEMIKFANVPMIPCLKCGRWEDGTWRNGEFHLFDMNHTFLVKSIRDEEELSDEVCEAVERLSVKILPSLPKWFETEMLPCIFIPKGPSIVRMFDQLSKNRQTICLFNERCNIKDADAIVELLAKTSTPLLQDTVSFLQQLKIFQRKEPANTSPRLSSMSNCNKIVSHFLQLPVCFPKPVLVSNSQKCLMVAKNLGAQEMSEEEIVFEILQTMIDTPSQYSNTKVNTFMLWFLDNMYRFQQTRLMGLARDIPFVDAGEITCKKKPSDLYDPTDTTLITLFSHENKFPINEFTTNQRLNALKLLGLRTKEKLTADCLYSTAKYLDLQSKQGQDRESLEPKAKMFLQVLDERSDSLSLTIATTKCQLHSAICDLQCIPHKRKRPHGYPEELSWKGSEFILCSPSKLKSVEFSDIAGSVFPLVRYNSERLGTIFKWNLHPDAQCTAKQLKNIVTIYNGKNKDILLRLISSVYRALMDGNFTTDPSLEVQNIIQGKYVWWGDGFCTPAQMVLESIDDDINLKPYMYTLPVELETLKPFFAANKCHQRQDLTVFLLVLQLIDEKYQKQKKSEEVEIRQDLQLVLQILNRLVRDEVKPEECGQNLLLPVQNENNRILLKPYTECTYCDTPWLKEFTEDNEDEKLFYVHEYLPVRIAQQLGVKSLKRQLMSDAEGLKEWGQEEHLTRRLHNILKDGYVDGLAVPKEIIQNADDAGASTVQFIYDERENADARTQLLDEKMASCQGPALWAYNDALFTEDDLKNITQLSGASKESDTTKIGKFGLGFCSVYNVTDVPSFVSGQNLVIFDPHKLYLKKVLPGESPGLKIHLGKLKNRKLLKQMQNQFKPYQGVFGCDWSSTEPSFAGTLFRLPLRTPEQAAVSEIRKTPYTKEEMVSLLKQFVEVIGDMLLFTQHLEEIKLFHIPAVGVAPSEAQLLCRVSKYIAFQNIDENISILKVCSDLKMSKSLHVQPLSVLQTVNITVEYGKDNHLLEVNGPATFSASWLISWATGSAESLELCKTTKMKGALPLGSIACMVATDVTCLSPISLARAPNGFYKTGHVFCYLPLPEETHLDVHVNGSFAVTSNRRGLHVNTEDDKYSDDTEWNKALFSDAVAQALANLLEAIHEPERFLFESLSNTYRFYQLWPVQISQLISSLKTGFYQNVIALNRSVFEGQNQWTSLKNCLSLNITMSQDATLRGPALSTLLKFRPRQDQVVIDLPVIYLNQLQDISLWTNSACVVEVQEFVTKYFIPNIHDSFWYDSEQTLKSRTDLLLFCLNQHDDVIKKSLRDCKCIPTSPAGALKKPSDLVQPGGKVSVLFTEKDERFPEIPFREHNAMNCLVALGMMQDTLTVDLVKDRAKSIPVVALTDEKEVALERCRQLLIYLSSSNSEPDVLGSLREIPFLPVLKKPNKWCFKWNAEKNMESKGMSNMQFERAENLFLESYVELVACTKNVIDDSIFAVKNRTACKEILKAIGLRTGKDINTKLLIEQLQSLCDSKPDSEQLDWSYVENVFDKIYQHLNNQASLTPEEFQQAKESLEGKNIILIGTKLLPVNKIALSTAFQCEPELYNAKNTRLARFERFLSAVGVKKRFEIPDVVKILDSKKARFQNNPLLPDDLTLIRNLLQLLADIMLADGILYDDLIEYGMENIVAPDKDCVLKPTYELCLDDPDFDEVCTSMNFVHDSISKQVAEALGVYTKRNKYIDDCSYGIPFEQKEELVTRLRGLLEEYPGNISVLKELIQNADDAHATEIHFIKDFRKHSCDKIFVETFEEFQGPALLVFNDSDFWQKDLEGIRKLGIGSKTADPTKTGQFGVGFNAVYNLTDTPAFMTIGPEIENGETICLFDPLQKHLKKHVGTQFNTTKLRKAFPDVLSGFCENELFPNKSPGTVFRFPLRQQESELSKNTVTENEVKTMCSTIIAEMQHMLLFLRSVQKIVVSDISSGNLIVEHSVCVELSEEGLEQRMKFAKVCKQRAKEIKELPNTMFTSMPVQVAYEMDIKDYLGKNARYFIVQRIGFSESLDATAVKHAEEGMAIGMLPVGGVAISIPQEETQSQCEVLQRHRKSKTALNDSCSGRLYCFLPLPGKTGLPVNINGHFVLDRARRGLWTEDKSGYRSAWNVLILSEVVAPAYIETLDYLRSMILQDTKLYNETSVYAKIETFNRLFPSENFSDKYLICLAERTFQKIVFENKPFFPLLQTVEIVGENDSFVLIQYRITWSEYQPKCHQLPVCFADRSEMKNSVLILMTKLGLKVTVRTLGILNSLAKVVGTCLEFTPVVVINFLKSVSSSFDDRAEIGAEIPAAIEETKFKNSHAINSILTFCMKEKTLLTELHYLPLLLSNDGYLRCFEPDRVVYCSKYCSLFTKSGSRFIHSDLVSKIKKIIGEEKYNRVRDLTICVLPELLSAELENRKTSMIFDSLSGIPERHWIYHFWMLVSEQYDIAKKSCPDVVFKNFVEPLKDWCLVPALIKKTNAKSLEKVENIGNLIALETFPFTMPLHDVLETLAVPTLDTINISFSALKLLSEGTASSSNPGMLLKCLGFHKESVCSSLFTGRDSEAILGFFNDNIDKMRADTGITEFEMKRCLKDLPLYLTLEMTHLAVGDRVEVVVFPLDIPTEGMEQWASMTGRHLLAERYVLRDLYAFLGFTNSNQIGVYLKYILETWNALPVEATETHLTYIKDHLLQKPPGSDYTADQDNLLSKLKTLEIIPCHGLRKRASAFYDRDVLLFKAMCESDEFPSGVFAKDEWKQFLIDVGLITEVTAGKFVEFAKTVASDGGNGITEDIAFKSKILMSHLLGQKHDWNPCVYKTLKHIKFVVPFMVEKRFTDVFQQFTDANHLICFSGSISRVHADLCWTRMPLLCEDADPDIYPLVEKADKERNQSLLGIHTSPTFEEFIRHCQNVCDSLQTLMQEEDKKTDLKVWIKELIISLYECLQTNHLSVNEAKRRLYHTPMVFLPDKMMMVPAHKTVLHIWPQQEIFPYLMKVPNIFDKFSNVFKHLGSAEKPSYLSYVKVLKELKDDIGEDILSESCVTEWLVMTAAIDNLFECLRQEGATDTVTDSTLKLYLPTRNNHYLNSSDIVVSDNNRREKRLRNVTDIQYFLGFRDLALFSHNWRHMKLLPKQLKPKFLTEITQEHVDSSEITELTHSDMAEKLERFFHSVEFIEGLIRLIKHAERRHAGEAKAVANEENVAEHFKSLQVREVSGLKTYLTVNGIKVESSLDSKSLFYQNRAGDWIIYFQKTSEQVFTAIRKDLVKFIDRVTKNVLSNYDLFIYEILNMMDNYLGISSYLDNNDIDEYNLPLPIQQGILPTPGTYVPDHLHHLLDFSITEISEYEFRCVALEVEDDTAFSDVKCSSNFTPVFMFVKIVEKIQTEPEESGYCRRYKIYTGDDYRIVSCLKIFKFKYRTGTCRNRELVSTDIVQTTLSNQTLTKELYSVEFSLREAWKLPRESRWQVIKRLLLRWHPDRNGENQELSSSVFCHLKTVLDELRQKSPEDVYPDTDTYLGPKKVYPDFTSPDFYIFIEKIETRGRNLGVQAQRFKENSRDEYSAPCRSKYVPLKYPQEGKRWQRQAKQDFTKSSESLGDDNFNWNCYMCHQAAEKSLKAAWFATNANGFDKKTHDLRSLSRGLTDEISVAVRDLHKVLGEYAEYSKMRYPDNIEREHIPSTLFTEKQAREAHTVTRKILDLVDEHYLG